MQFVELFKVSQALIKKFECFGLACFAQNLKENITPNVNTEFLICNPIC